MRPLASTATPSLFCTPASDIDMPSSPTRNGLLGSSSMMRSSAASLGTRYPSARVGGTRPADRQRAGRVAADLGENGDGVLRRRAEPPPDRLQLRCLRQEVGGPRLEYARQACAAVTAASGSRVGMPPSCAAIRGRRRTTDRPRGSRWCRRGAFRRRLGAQPREGSSTCSGRSGSRALSSLVSAMRSNGRRPTATATTSALPSWQVGLPASSSMMKRRPTPVVKARSSWRQFSALRGAHARARRTVVRMLCAVSFCFVVCVGCAMLMFPIGNI